MELDTAQVSTFGSWIVGVISTLFGIKVLSRRDRMQEAKSDVNITDDKRLLAEIEYSRQLAVDMRKLSRDVAGLQSSVMAIGTMLEAMVLCEDCRRVNAPFIRKIASQVEFHIPKDNLPREAPDSLDPEVRAQVDEFFRERGYTENKEK